MVPRASHCLFVGNKTAARARPPTRADGTTPAASRGVDDHTREWIGSTEQSDAPRVRISSVIRLT
jgi:hypothetical protein